MKSKRLKINISLLLFTIITLVGFFVGSKLDQQISLEVGNRDNILSIIFTAIGCFPTLYLAIFAGTALTVVEYKTKFGKIFMKIIGILAIIIVSLFLYYTSSDYAKFPRMLEHQTLYKVLLLCVVLLLEAVVIILTILFRKKFNQKNLFVIAIMILSIVASCGIVSEGIKILASRPRPSFVIYTEGAVFKNWFQWNPFYSLENSQCKSFVSGHSTDTACLLTVLPLFLTLTPLTEKKYTYVISFICAGMYTYFVGLTRLLGQAHYLTDVMGGILLSIIMQSICLRLVPFILRKIDEAISKVQEKENQ